MKEQYEKIMFSEDFHKASYKKMLIFELIEAAISFLCFYSVYACFIYIDTLDETKIYSGVPMLLTVLAMVYLKRKVKPLVKFAVVSIITAAISIAVLYSDITVTYNIIFLLGYFIYYVGKARKNKNSFLTVAQLTGMNIFMGFLYGFSLLYSAAKLQAFLFELSILHVVISFVYFYLSSSEKVLYWEECNDSKYKSNLRNVNIMFSVILVLLLTFVLTISLKAGVFRELDYLYGYLLNSWIKVPLPNWQPGDMQNNISLAGNSRLANIAKDNPFGVVQYSFLWYIFVAILVIGCVVLVIIAVIGVVLTSLIILQLIYKRVRTKNEPGVEREFATSKEIVQDTLSKARESLDTVKKTIYRSNREKVRGIYTRLVNGYISKGLEIETSNTPLEIQDNISSKYKASVVKATEIYEKARYGKENILDKEVNEIKKYLK